MVVLVVAHLVRKPLQQREEPEMLGHHVRVTTVDPTTPLVAQRAQAEAVVVRHLLVVLQYVLGFNPAVVALVGQFQ